MVGPAALRLFGWRGATIAATSSLYAALATGDKHTAVMGLTA